MTDRVEGLSEVLANLNNAVNEIEKRTAAGLLEAGLHLERRSKALVPVDTGNLRASGYTRRSAELEVEVGYQASYAVFVHENLEAKHTNGQAKFLEQPLREDAALMLEIIARRARVDASA